VLPPSSTESSALPVGSSIDQSVAARSASADLSSDSSEVAWFGADLTSVSLADVRMATEDWASFRSAAADLAEADRATAELSSAEARPSAGSQSADPMVEYHQLQIELLVTTLILSALIFPLVWWVYGLNIALNYLLGACTGVVYLKLLARNVERIGTGSSQPGKSNVAIVIGVLVVATQRESLHVLPVFLGFLTFKLTLILYTLRILLTPSSSSN
jgi:ATP synthase protein I